LPLRQLNGSNSARQLIGSNFFQFFKKVQTTLNSFVNFCPLFLRALAATYWFQKCLAINWFHFWKECKKIVNYCLPDATQPLRGFRLDLVHPEDRELFISERRKGFLEGQAFGHEAQSLRHDGQFRRFLIRFAAIEDERRDITRWCSITTDIEDR